MTTPLIRFSLALACSLAPIVAVADAPYRALVSDTTAEVLSGPGDEFYPTQALAEGSLVEVHEADGQFLAIRPPRGSFSLAAEADIELVEPGVGVVLRDGMASRVGSLLSDDRDAVHVRLDENERVQVLGRTTLDGVVMLKLAPPSGEFRWIRAETVQAVEQLADAPPVVVETPRPPVIEPTPPLASPEGTLAPASKEATADPIVIEAPAVETDLDLPVAVEEPAPFATEASPLAAWVDPAAHEEAASAPEGPPITPIPPSATPSAPPPASPPATSPAAPAPPDAAPESRDFSSKLRRLEVELARRVARPAALWRLDDLQAEAIALQTAGTEPAHRSAAIAFAQRTQRFQTIAQRRRAMQAVPPPIVRTKANPAIPAAAVAAGNVVGELRTVVSKRADAPKFAVIDPQGRVLTFLTPQPGMDLTPVIGKRVEVTGAEGYLPTIRSRHVTATRVAQLPPTTRR